MLAVIRAPARSKFVDRGGLSTHDGTLRDSLVLNSRRPAQGGGLCCERQISGLALWAYDLKFGAPSSCRLGTVPSRRAQSRKP
jgi:hypothetical protein